MAVKDEELHKAIEESAFHVGMKAAQAEAQQRYRKKIQDRLIPRLVELMQLISGALVSGKYRVVITKTRNLVALMERISED